MQHPNDTRLPALLRSIFNRIPSPWRGRWTCFAQVTTSLIARALRNVAGVGSGGGESAFSY